MSDFEKEKKIIIDHFKQALKKYKRGPMAISWGSRKSQIVRFEALYKIGDLNGKTVLDLGCGFGDFYEFLTKKKKVKLKKYLGIDMNPLIISEAKKKYPKEEFITGNLLENPPKESFDYVFESGIFNIKVPNLENLIKKTLVQMYGICKLGVGVNFLSSFTPFKKDKKSYYVNPFKMSDFIQKNLSSKFVLKHDYKPNDFTVFFYKDSKK